MGVLNERRHDAMEIRAVGLPHHPNSQTSINCGVDADAAASAGAAVVKAGASAAGRVVDAVLPSKDKK